MLSSMASFGIDRAVKRRWRFFLVDSFNRVSGVTDFLVSLFLADSFNRLSGVTDFLLSLFLVDSFNRASGVRDFLLSLFLADSLSLASGVRDFLASLLREDSFVLMRIDVLACDVSILSPILRLKELTLESPDSSLNVFFLKISLD